MTAQVHFHRGREPAQLAGVSARDHEGGLGQVVLRRNGLKGLVRQPFVHGNHGRRVAAEKAVGEGINLVDGVTHESSLQYRIGLKA